MRLQATVGIGVVAQRKLWRSPPAPEPHRSADKIMRITQVIGAGLMLMLVGLSSLYAAEIGDSTWDAYVARTLGAIIKQHESDAVQTDKYFTADNFPTRAKAFYLGKQRSLPKERAAFLDKYFLHFTKQSEFRKLFKSEILVREGEQEYWLSIQTDLLPSLQEEVKPGAEVELFITWLGAVRTSGKLEWIFTINEFQAVQAGE